MGTTSEELKKLYAKLGGKDPKVAGFSAPGEILNAINEIPLPTEYELPTVTKEDTGDVLVVNEEGHWDKGEASGGLPDVTAADNGDILQVVEGAWTKAELSDNLVVLHAKKESDYLSIQDATVNQINNYLNNGKIVVVLYGTQPLLASYDGNYLFGIRRTSLAKIDLSYYQFFRLPAKYMRIDGYQLPRAYSDINGKVLTVKNGEWSAENPPASLPEVTAADNGDILQVVEGAWAKASATSGACIIYNVGAFSNGSQLSVSGGKSADDINSSISDGKNPVLVGSDGKVYYYAGVYMTPMGYEEKNFVSHTIDWDSTNNKYVVKLYRVYYNHSSTYYVCENGAITIG